MKKPSLKTSIQKYIFNNNFCYKIGLSAFILFKQLDRTSFTGGFERFTYLFPFKQTFFIHTNASYKKCTSYRPNNFLEPNYFKK